MRCFSIKFMFSIKFAQEMSLRLLGHSGVISDSFWNPRVSLGAKTPWDNIRHSKYAFRSQKSLFWHENRVQTPEIYYIIAKTTQRLSTDVLRRNLVDSVVKNKFFIYLLGFWFYVYEVCLIQILILQKCHLNRIP